MSTNRLFNLLIVVAVLLLVGLTVREVTATSSVIADGGSPLSVCDSLPSRDSIHTQYDERSGTSVIYSEDGPTGVDGGIIDLMSAYRACSK